MRLLFAAALSCAAFTSARAESGVASVYSDCGKPTASGEPEVCSAMTAAHKAPLPLGTLVRVTTGDRSIVVRINDRGPFVKGRIIDLTPGAARALGCDGLCNVTVEPVK